MSFGIYETVTNRIIAELEAGAIPWTQPWDTRLYGLPVALLSGMTPPLFWFFLGSRTLPSGTLQIRVFRPLRIGHDNSFAAQMSQMAAGDTNVQIVCGFHRCLK